MAETGDKQAPESAVKMRPEGPVTLEHVAARAGVSPATVSRCLNAPDSVRPHLKARVDAAIRELDYIPHAAARALASRRSRLIGTVFPALQSSLFGGTLESLQHEIEEAGYSLVVASSGYDPDREERHINNLIAGGVDALVMVGAERHPEIYRRLGAKGIPYILAWISDPSDVHPCAGFDNVLAARKVTQYLLDLGHRRFAMISGRLRGNDRASGRWQGVQKTLEPLGLTVPTECVQETNFDAESGSAAFRQLVGLVPRPTAIICGSEPHAYGAIFEARRMGIRVPQDISITGFDNMWLASQIEPSLTTVNTPRREMGITAAKYLLARLAGEQVSFPALHETELVVRQSTARPPAGR